MPYPKTLYVKEEQDGDSFYLLASEDLSEHAEVGEKVKVGVYELKQTSILTAKPEIA
jgi:hypothetical protein